MTEQQTPDREKKIAEIREALKWVEWGKYPITAYASLEHWLRFLLSELERKDEVIEEQKRELFYKSKEITELREKSWQDQQWFKQASANITEMQKELDREREENRKLRERLKEELVWQDECLKLEEQLQSAQQDRDKLIEGLRWYADKTNYVQEVHHLRHGTLIGPAEAIYYDEGQRAREILKEIGVTVEWQKSANDMRITR